MKMRIFLLLSMVLILILSGCAANRGSLPESTLLPDSEAAQTLLPLDSNDEFQPFIEKWELFELIPEGLTMTAEQQDKFIKYFQKFDDVTQTYILLLLQEISSGTTTLRDNNIINDHENGIYLMSCQFCLYDMNRDGFPEFILKTGSSEADYWYTVYTAIDGELIDCGGLSGSHATLYTNGSGGFVRYAGHMGVYDINVSTLAGTTLITKEIANGELDGSKGEDYPELDEYGYGDYDQYMPFSGIPTLFLAPAG